MTTTAQALLEIALLLKETYSGSATQVGTTTNLIDSAALKPADWWSGGTIWFATGPNAGKTAVITDYAQIVEGGIPKGSFTFPAQAGVVQNTDAYTVARGNYPRQALVNALNQALRECGKVMQINASLAGVADQAAYTLPAGVTTVLRVVVGSTINYHWQQSPTQIIFDAGYLPAAGATISLWHIGEHASVLADADVVSDCINRARLAWLGAYYAALNRMQHVENNEPHTKEFAGLAQGRIAEMSMRFPNIIIPRDPHLGGF